MPITALGPLETTADLSLLYRMSQHPQSRNSHEISHHGADSVFFDNLVVDVIVGVEAWAAQPYCCGA